VYQVSTIGALAQGVYGGEITCGELREHGDFGIGTFDRLDGEMILADGAIYQARADGSVRTPDDLVRVPFAAVTFFTPDRTSILSRNLDLEGLERALDGLLPTENIFYAVKVEGNFQYVKTRSVPAQDKPYRPLTEAVKEQRTCEFNNTEGVLVGLRCPAYMKEINVPAYHFHFITRDRRAGGHMLECRVEGAQVAIDEASEFHMVLPRGNEFYRAQLGADAQSVVDRIEKAEGKKAR
jgi:acetolactate decarboxylase